MRALPRAAGRPALAALVFVVTLGALVVPLAHADERDDLQDQQDAVQQQIEQTEDDAEEASRAVSAAATALATAESQLAVAQAHLTDSEAHVSDVSARLLVAEAEDARMKAALDVARANLIRAEADVVAGRAALQAQQATVKQSVVGAYQQGPPGLLALTGYLQAQDPTDLTRKLEYADTVVEVQASAFERLRQAEIALRTQREQVREAEQAVSDQADQAAQQLLAVQELKDEADEAADAALLAQDAVTVTVAAREAAQRRAEQARAADLAELATLKKQEERIKQKILEAARRDRSRGFVGVDDGFLLPPVDGAVTSPFGYRIHPIYGYWGLHDGTDFGVACGEGMRAAADGTVLSSSYSSIYGNRLYLDVGKVNGHALTVVYNHATSYRVGVGDTVKRGEIVGYVGSTGWSTGCHLHFTVLQDGEAVDPMTYL